MASTKRKGCIYKITSPSNKIYIGQSTDVKKRWSDYNSLCCKYQPRLYNSLKKHGVEKHSFEIIEECDFFLLNERERYWQEYYNVIGKNGLNCRLTKINDKSGFMSVESRIKMSVSQTGKKHSEETKRKISDAGKGRKMSKESILKSVNSRKGFKHSKETKDKMSSYFKGLFKGEKNPFYGRKHTEEAKEKMRQKKIKHGKSVVSKKDVKKRIKYYYLDTVTGVYFETCKEAGESLNIKRTTMDAMINGQNRNRTNIVKV